MKPPIIFTRYGSNTEITQSVFGTGTINGTLTYAACKFGNGCNNLSATNNPQWAGVFEPDLALIDFWWKPSYASTASTDDAFFKAINGAENTEFYRKGSRQTIEMYTYSGSYKSFYAWNAAATGAWAANDVIHVQMQLDASASNNNRFKLWINGSLKTPSAYNNNATWSFSTATFYGGKGRTANSVQDNLKVWSTIDDQALINTNRENERFGCNDQ